MREQDIYDATRHVDVSAGPWDPAEARAVIARIAGETQQAFHEDTFWPAHPLDQGFEDCDPSIYGGAAGVIWALDYLRRRGAAAGETDFARVLPRLIESSRRATEQGRYPHGASLLLGDLGALLVSMRIAPCEGTADRIFARATANTSQPIRELMWGLPGSMLACVHMDRMTGEARWHDLFRTQAERLIADLRDTEFGPLWYQDLYGTIRPWLGPVHGFAGNMIPLLLGWRWLDDAQRQRMADAARETLSANARRSPDGVNWPPRPGDPKTLCQYCHGAPGMLAAFADAPGRSPEIDELLLRGGDLIWTAGALAKGAGLCHGTGGNGYAFLKLYRQTGDVQWLTRARAFAMMAINQFQAHREHYGRCRYSLWTGDLGLAVYLLDCIDGTSDFPTIDCY